MNSAFPHRNLLGIASLSTSEVNHLLGSAETIFERGEVPTALAGRVQVNAFFESSTRTSLSFDLAGKRLGLHVLGMTVAGSSIVKGESLADTARTLEAIGADVIVLRHSQPAAPEEVARAVSCAVVNAGDGINEHPTQALIDALVLRKRFGRLEGLTVTICGDIRHSRVARSNMLLLTRMGARVRLTGPANLLPVEGLPEGASVVANVEEAIAGANAIMMLRVQHERMQDRLDLSPAEYHAAFGLTRTRLALARADAVVMHPGPINRDIEIASDIADDASRAVILDQVALGVPVRMACLAACLEA